MGEELAKPNHPPLEYDMPAELHPQPVLDLKPREPSDEEFGPWLPMGRGSQAAMYVLFYAAVTGLLLIAIAVFATLMRGC